MPRTRLDDQGVVHEIPPRVLDCGHPYGQGLVVIGYDPTPDGGRARTYWCRVCRQVTLDR